MSFAAYTARLREISARTGAPTPYLMFAPKTQAPHFCQISASRRTSFAILHEATAIVPFVGIFFAARYHGMGQKAISMLASAAAEKSDDSWLVRKSSEWMIQGEQFAARLGRRYGLFGFEKGAPRDAQPALETRASQQIAGDVANVVVAYVAVKFTWLSLILCLVARLREQDVKPTKNVFPPIAVVSHFVALAMSSFFLDHIATTSWQWVLVVAATLLVIVVTDRVWQRTHARWTNEPPMLPYTIPFVGHGLMYGKSTLAPVKKGTCLTASHIFILQPQVIPSPKDANVVYRKSKAFAFLPLVESFAPLAWGISKHGMDLLKSDASGPSMLQSTHGFYYTALKEGPELDELSLKFTKYVREALDSWFSDEPHDAPLSLRGWSRIMIGSAATNSVFGPSILKRHPQALEWVKTVDASVRRPRQIMDAFAEYLQDESNRDHGAPMIWERYDQMAEKGMELQDRARYTYSVYAALMTSSVPISASLLFHIFYDPKLLARIRDEIAPVFAGGRDITTIDQVQALLNDCPVLRAAFNEALRVYSPAASSRRVVQEATVSGYTLKPGKHVLIPRTRIIGGGGDAKQVRAFGGGTTLCSGRYFASNEVMSYVAAVVWRCDVQFVQGGKVVIGERDLDVPSGKSDEVKTE
ncbi:cytochrome P450 [Auriculariales sp. MPI-PUGE-AT-0066]|nr:cytochrome P450 [Auriculariales sp. MPI-PUGE-AT-0066]